MVVLPSPAPAIAVAGEAECTGMDTCGSSEL